MIISLTDSNFVLDFFLFTSIVMSAPSTGTNGNKQPAEGVEPEAAILKAFVDNGFPVWAQRVPGDHLARQVAELTVKC